jgi:hypothetical protein
MVIESIGMHAPSWGDHLYHTCEAPGVNWKVEVTDKSKNSRDVASGRNKPTMYKDAAFAEYVFTAWPWSSDIAKFGSGRHR